MAQFTIRIADELHDRIKAAAAEDRRSGNGEIEWLLEMALKWRHSVNRVIQANEQRGEPR